jgi:hypothetical protein
MLKGVFVIVAKQLIAKKLFFRFSQWRSKVDFLRLEKMNNKIEKYTKRKQYLSLNIMEKIIQKLDIFSLFWKNHFFEKLTLFSKLKNSLNDYGRIFKRVPELVGSDEEKKALLLLIRDTYSKPIKIMKIRVLLAKKHASNFFTNYKKYEKESGFFLNSAFTKWKKITIDAFAKPSKIVFSLTKIRNIFQKNRERLMNQFFNNILKSFESKSQECFYIPDYKLRLCYVVEKVSFYFI